MKLEYPLKGIGTTPGIYKTQGFGEHLNPYPGLLGHNGIDYGAPLGTPVLAAHDGRLITKPTDPDGYGIYVRVEWEEDGFTYDTVYGHFQRIEGNDRLVKAGDIVGYVDSTGYSTGDHLHFGVRKKLNGIVVDYNNGYLGYFDPEPYFQGEQMVVFFQVKNSSTVWVLVQGEWIGFSDISAFNKFINGRTSVVIQLDQIEFNKVKTNPNVFKT